MFETLGRLLGTVQRALDPVSLTASGRRPTDRSRAVAGPFEVRVADVVQETRDCVTLVLEPESVPVPAFRAGQYLNLTTHIDGSDHTRAYSISGREAAGLRVTIKAMADGTVSRHFCRDVQPGQVVRVSGPHGSFVLPDDASAPLAFLAVGSGITPILSMITTALAQDESRRICLVYANRAPSDVIFAELLKALEADHPSLQVTHVLTKPGRGWSGERGRLAAERALLLLAPEPDAHVYVCGPEELIDATVTRLREAGLAPGNVHRERFTPRTRSAVDEGEEQHSVSWLRSGIDDAQRAGETLLDAANRADADVPFICEAGECGECKIRVLAGEVIHEPDTCLTAEESAEGFALACSSYAVSDVEVEA